VAAVRGATFFSQEFSMKNPTCPRSLTLVLALLLSFGVAVAQTSGTTGAGSSMTGGKAAPAVQPGTGTRNAETSKDDKLAPGDRKFMQDAWESGMFAVQAAQLGSVKAKDPSVKSFAGMLADQRAAANNELVQLANSKKVELPAAATHAMRREIASLTKRTGKEFDQEFVRNVGIEAHEKDIKKFERARMDVKDAQLRAWIDKTMPTLLLQLAQAQKLPQAPGG
jgi:putative membrane protein